MDTKKRAPNFSKSEESLLVDIVTKYRHIVECKKTDTTSHMEKNDCWAKIEVDFNGISGVTSRSKEVLRKKYENLKKRVKKVGEESYNRGTGGGPPVSVHYSDLETSVKHLLGSVRIEGAISELDHDALALDSDVKKCNLVPLEATENSADHARCMKKNDEEQMKNRTTDEEGEMPTQVVDRDFSLQPGTSQECDDGVEPVANNWGKYNPAMLRKRKSEKLQVPQVYKKMKTRHERIDRVSEWAAAKTKLETYKEILLQEEHSLKLKLLKEKHDQDMLIKQKKADLELQQMTEEHNLKIEILLLEQRQKENNFK
ncbi:hypothetical protein HUJ04_012867 [Dendroctonus ponderosae]|nr:hypothetical protein HUJ04_012867 [Dendroctonus ponderosae]KAH1006934.1 hypothetical protein HUJ05_007619 [Dendroctonus ponderosae]